MPLFLFPQKTIVSIVVGFDDNFNNFRSNRTRSERLSRTILAFGVPTKLVGLWGERRHMSPQC